jgi:hypothetical protein
MVWPRTEVKESVTPCGSPEGRALWSAPLSHRPGNFGGNQFYKSRKNLKVNAIFTVASELLEKLSGKKFIFSKRFAKGQNNPSIKV